MHLEQEVGCNALGAEQVMVLMDVRRQMLT